MIMSVECFSEKTYTLCCKKGEDEFSPLADFDTADQANKLAEKINKTGFAINLDELATSRIFLIFNKKNQVLNKFHNLTEAISFLGIKVDFPVEKPEEIITDKIFF